MVGGRGGWRNGDFRWGVVVVGLLVNLGLYFCLILFLFTLSNFYLVFVMGWPLTHISSSCCVSGDRYVYYLFLKYP